MENEFKIPAFESKVKFVPRKTKENDDTSSDAECKQIEVDDGDPTNIAEVKPPISKQESIIVKTSTKCPYVEPKWSSTSNADHKYQFEILKNGQIVENVNDLQTKAFWTIGKLPDNNIIMAHPTISRYHAVLQYRPEIITNIDTEQGSDSDDESNEIDTERPSKSNSKIEKGWYLYDLNSTHGSFVNKMRIPPKTYVRVRVGYMLKFGASTRNYILQGPNFDEDAESELTITEMKELRRKKEQDYKEKLIEEEKRKEAAGVNWGMADDADEETDLSHNPFASTNNEELFLQDPKKTLRGYFERDGYDLEYKVDEMSAGSYICKVELPITDSMGRNIIAEFAHKGKKKDCVLQCALEACRILDRHGVLRQANHEPQRRRKVDSSSEDDDEFYDRTTEAEEKRKRKAGNDETGAMSYEQLLIEEVKLEEHLANVERKICKYQEQDKQAKQKIGNDEDDLDDYMSNLSNEKALDKTEIRKLRFEVQRIKADIAQNKKLINITRPLNLPPIKLHTDTEAPHASETKKKVSLPLFGKKRTFGFGKPNPISTQIKTKIAKTAKAPEPQENVEEFDEDDDEKDSTSIEKIPTNAKCIETTLQTKLAKDELTDIIKNTKTNTACDKVQKAKETGNEKESSDLDAELDQSTGINTDVGEQHVNTDANKLSNKKKRSRVRARSGKARDNIDIDDTEEPVESEKYVKWMPPENQTGDGVTDLNSKYGY